MWICLLCLLLPLQKTRATVQMSSTNKEFLDGWTPIAFSDCEKGDATTAVKARAEKLRCALQQVVPICCTPTMFWLHLSLCPRIHNKQLITMRPSLASPILIGYAALLTNAAFGRLIPLYHVIRAPPTGSPTAAPSSQPTARPSSQPTSSPSFSP